MALRLARIPCDPPGEEQIYRQIDSEIMDAFNEWRQKVTEVLDQCGDKMKTQIAHQVNGGTVRLELLTCEDSPTITLYRAGYGHISNDYGLAASDFGKALPLTK